MRRNRVPFERPGDRPSYIPFASRFSDGPDRGTVFSDKSSKSKNNSTSTTTSAKKEKTEEEFIREEEEELVKVEKKWEEEEKKADLEYVNSEIARSLKRLSKTVEGRTPTPSPESDSDDESYNYHRTSVANLALSMMAGMNDRVVDRGPRRAFHTGPAIANAMPIQAIRNVPFQQSNPPMNRQITAAASRPPLNTTAMAALNNLRAGLAKRVGAAIPKTELSTTSAAAPGIRGGIITGSNRGGFNNNRGGNLSDPTRGLNKPIIGLPNNISRGGFPNNRRGGLPSNNRGGLINNNSGALSNNRRGGPANIRGNYTNHGRGFNGGRGRAISNNRGRGFTNSRGDYNNTVGINSRRGGPANNFRRGFDNHRGHGRSNRGGFGNNSSGRGQVINSQIGLQQGNIIHNSIQGEPIARVRDSVDNRGMLAGRRGNSRGGRFSSNRAGGRNNQSARGHFGREPFRNPGRGQLINPNIDSRLQHGNNPLGGSGAIQGNVNLPTRPVQSNRGTGFIQPHRGRFDGNRGRGLIHENMRGGIAQNNRGRGFVTNNSGSFRNNVPGEINAQRFLRFQQGPPQQMQRGGFRGRGHLPGRDSGPPGRGAPATPAWYKEADLQKSNAFIHPSRRNMVPTNPPNNGRGLPLRMPSLNAGDIYANRSNLLRPPPTGATSLQPFAGAKKTPNQFPKEKVVECVYKFIKDRAPNEDVDGWKWKGVLFSELVTHLKQEFVFITPEALFEVSWNQFFHNMVKIRDVECINVLPEGPSIRIKSSGLPGALAEAQKVVLEHLKASEPKDEQQITSWKGVQLETLEAHFLLKFDFQHLGYKKFAMFLQGIQPCEMITDSDKCYVRLKLEARPKVVFKPQNVEERTLKIMRERTRDPWTIKQRMINQFADGVVKEKVSLRDPYSAGLLKIPCKGLQCTHRQAFDLEVFLKMLRPDKKPLCPICQKLVSESTIWVDGYWLAVCKRWADKEPESCVLHVDGKVSLESGEEFDPAPVTPGSTISPQKTQRAEPPAALKIEDQHQYIQHHYKKKQEVIQFRVNFSKLKDIVTEGDEQAPKQLSTPSSSSCPVLDKSSSVPKPLKRGRTQLEEIDTKASGSHLKSSAERSHKAAEKLSKLPAPKRRRSSPSYDLAAEYNDIFGNDEKPVDNARVRSSVLQRAYLEKPQARNSQHFSNVRTTPVKDSRLYVDTRIQQPPQPRIENYPRSPVRDTRLGDTRLRGAAPTNGQSSYQHDGLIRDSKPYNYNDRPTTQSRARYNQRAYSQYRRLDQQQKIQNEPRQVYNQNTPSSQYPENPSRRCDENRRFANPDPTQLQSFDSRAPPSLPRNSNPPTNMGPLISQQSAGGKETLHSIRPNTTKASKGLTQPR